MREHMCSAWTVTLHHQTLTTLARALRQRRPRRRQRSGSSAQAEAVRRDFQRLLLVDDVLAGYALFEPTGTARRATHLPAIRRDDDTTGVRYSSLAMIHAILEDLFDAASSARSTCASSTRI